MRQELLAFAAVIGLCGNAGGAETTTPGNWPMDCVGRLLLALPGEADQGALLPKEFFRDWIQYGNPSPRFPDGEDAGWSNFAYMELTHPLTDKEKEKAKKGHKRERGETAVLLKTNQNIVWYAAGTTVNTGFDPPPRRFSGVFIAKNGVLLTWAASSQDKDAPTRLKTDLQTIAIGVRPRVLFDVPKEPGICLPYLFIADDGKEQHSIAMTYRLKAHPDITINLKSETAEPTPKPGGDIRSDAVTNDFQTDLYWGTVTAPGNVKSAKSLWHFPAKRSMKLAGRPGLETFLAILRNNATEEDYIYHAVARGDPDQPEDAPDVRLVVEQTRANATKRGITPLSKEQVLTLARKIAVSVVPRPPK